MSYSSYSERLAGEVQRLLLEFGVISRICGPTSRGEHKVVITNRRDARLFAEHVGFLGVKQEKLRRDLATIPLESRALSHDHVPYLATYIREESGARGRIATWLAQAQRRSRRALGARRRRRSWSASRSTRRGGSSRRS